MLKLIEATPLPEVCRKCEEQCKLYMAANDVEKLRMEQEDGFFFDCGCCEHGLERFSLVTEDD